MTRSTRRNHVLVSYDIADDRRRTGVFETCRDFGNHVQYSVFLCELDRREFALLRDKLAQLIHHGDDQILMVHLGPATRDVLATMDVLGQPYDSPGRQLVV